MKTLVLNADFRPVTVVSQRRAVVLVLSDRAVSMELSDTVFHSASMEIQVPCVIRLVQYVKIPYRGRAPLTKRGVLVRDAYRCCYCNEKASTIDHILPRSRGGVHSWENCVAACKRCNSKKDDRTPQEAGMNMGVRPYAPNGPKAIIIAIGYCLPEWETWLN